MQYSIGSATWGYPILWQRERDGEAWVGAEVSLDDLTPDDITNWDAYWFACWLHETVQVGDWLYLGYGGYRTIGWYQVTRVERWCAYVRTTLGGDTINFLDITHYAPADKSNIVQRGGMDWDESVKWALYGF